MPVVWARRGRVLHCTDDTLLGEKRGWGEGEGGYSCHACPSSYDLRPSHPYNTGVEQVGFFTDQEGIAFTKLAKRREVLGKSHER